MSEIESVSATLASPARRGTGEDRSIRPFKANIPRAQIDDLRRRIRATRFPECETVDDFSQGVQLAKLKPLVEYCGPKYDWRKAEAKLNALHNFVTSIDGLDIHYLASVRFRSRPPLPSGSFRVDRRKTGYDRYGKLSIKQRIFCQWTRRTKPAARRDVGCRGRWQKIAWTKPPADACELRGLNVPAGRSVAALPWQASGLCCVEPRAECSW